MLNKKIIIICFAAMTAFVLSAVPVKAGTLPTACVPYAACTPGTAPTAEQVLLAQAAWNAYVNQAKASQAALTDSYADKIIAVHQNALINQAVLVHHFSIGSPNPDAAQASADWAALNMVMTNNPYATAITFNPYYYPNCHPYYYQYYYPY
ncbi:MAG: hypothetical protein IK111_09080 [Lachnospiraceae bacterium]|nr:hypothetical protein [Lachnospiraceae bacterium]MBR6487044.1 hypothetical protein [Lachnospiraceae bacterium]